MVEVTDVHDLDGFLSWPKDRQWFDVERGLLHFPLGNLPVINPLLGPFDKGGAKRI